ncbi:MAG TPA: hypothetical protein VGE67_19980 [Haloferula sp.]
MKLLPVATICRFLGKDPKDGEHLLESGLPVARIPGEAKNTPRVVPSAFIGWMSERLGGTARREDIEKDLREFVAEETSKKGVRKA